VHDAALAAQLRSLRNHGITKDAATRHGRLYTHWDMVELGYKAALTDIQAALLWPQLERIQAQRERRAAVVERYQQQLRGHADIQLLARVGESAHHLFALLIPAELRDGVLAGLGRRRIGCGVNYRSVHTLEFYRERFGYQRAAFPQAADFGERTVSLPLWPDLPLDDVTVVVDALGESLEEARQHAVERELPAAPEVT
jgi:UDP-4-amino-4-deoxy-L-arabinose-oxoglutarate aminotransferase